MEFPQLVLLFISYILAGTVALAFRSKALDWAVSIYGLSMLVKIGFDGVQGPTGDVWVFGMAISGLVVKFWNYALIMEPEKLAWKGDKGKVGVVKTYQKSSGLTEGIQAQVKDIRTRLLDGLDLMLVARGIGRNFEVRGIYQHKRPPPSLPVFIVGNIWGAFWRFLLLDLCRHFFLSTHLAGLQPLKGPLDYNAWTAIVFGALTWQCLRWRMEMQYRLASTIGVLVGWGQPSEWLPAFGTWTEAWTIRRLWSRAWHHNMRIPAEPPTALLVQNICGAKSKTLFARYGRLAGVFFISCMIHVLGRSLAGGDVKVDYLYFGSQVVLIVLEDCVQHLATRTGLITPGGRVSRWIGYLWTFVVQSWTLAWWVDGMVRKGWLAEPVCGFSVVDSVLPRIQAYASNVVRQKGVLVDW